MAAPDSFFTDGTAYERFMGRWSRATGEVFLDWLALPAGLRWLDVGCGTGAFTELVVSRCSPAGICGVDPAAEQVGFARSRTTAQHIDYRVGDAQSLPFGDDEFDAATMALVISFVPDPAQAVAEMKRVTKPGGLVAAYMWDLAGNGGTQEPMRDGIRAMGLEVPETSRTEFTRLDILDDLFDRAGLDDVDGRVIEIRCEFADFDDFWESQTCLATPVAKLVLAMASEQAERLKELLCARLPTDSAGRISYIARANAVKGRVPASG